MILETFTCDRDGCNLESEPSEAPPEFWVELVRYGVSEDLDITLHYCSWECAMHGTAAELERFERMGTGE